MLLSYQKLILRQKRKVNLHYENWVKRSVTWNIQQRKLLNAPKKCLFYYLSKILLTTFTMYTNHFSKVSFYIWIFAPKIICIRIFRCNVVLLFSRAKIQIIYELGSRDTNRINIIFGVKIQMRHFFGNLQSLWLLLHG